MIEIVVVCGQQNSGKTTWITHLVPELQRRGLRVGTIKHTHHDYAVVGKDTTRHQHAGAERVVLASAKGAAIYESWPREPDLQELAERFFSGFDLVLAEGYRRSRHHKLVVGSDDVELEGFLATLDPVDGALDPIAVRAAADLIEKLIPAQRRHG